MMVRWPGKIPAGVVSNEIVQHHDWLPTFLAAAGEPDVVEKLKKGYEAAGKRFKVHIDGYNLLPYLTGEEDDEPAQGVHLLLGRRRPRRAALRQLEDRLHGAAVARDARRCGPSRSRRSGLPKLFNLRTDPFERADVTSNTYWDWFVSKGYMILAAQAIVAEFLATFKEFPPRQKAASFTIDQALEKMADAASGARG